MKRIIIKFYSLILSNKLFVFIFILGIVWELFFFNNYLKSAWEEGLTFAWYMSQGLIPYKDFLIHYFPFFYMMMVPLHQVFGFTQTPTILLAPISTLLIFSLLAICGLKWLTGWYKIIPLIFFLIWVQVLDENQFATNSYQNFINFLAFVLWWSWYQVPRKLIAFFLGLLLGMSLMSSQIVVFFVLILITSIIFKSLKNRKYVGSVVIGLIGFLIPIAFIFIYLISHNVLEIFLKWSIGYFFSGSGYPFAIGGKTWKDILVFSAVFCPVLLVAYALRLRLNGLPQKLIKKYEISQYFFWLLISFSFPLPFWFALFHPNRFILGLAVFAITLGFGVEMVLRGQKKIHLATWLILGLIIIFQVLSIWIYAIPKYQKGFSYSKQDQILSELQQNDPMYDTVKWIRDNTPQNARLFVTTSTTLYFETKRFLINKRATSNLPFLYRPLDQFGSELQEKPPDYWVIDERQWARFDGFGYPDATIFLKKILACEPVIVKFDYITIRKHIQGQKLCLI